MPAPRVRPGETPAEQACYDRGYRNGFIAGRRAAEKREARSTPETRDTGRTITALRVAGQRLWERLSTMQGWARLVKDRLPREDTVTTNEAALQETKVLLFGGREP